MRKHNIVIGIALGIIFEVIFLLIAVPLRGIITNTIVWKLINSFQRILFGVAELIIFIKLFDKGHIRNVINFHNFKKALFAGIPLILYTLYIILYIVFGYEGFSGLNFWLVVCLILQQLATGFWEELTFRGYFMQGFIDKYEDKLSYNALSCLFVGINFGLLHAVESTSWHLALYRFITTGILGIAFASIFLYSKNLLAPMILHAIYDIPANILSYADNYKKNPFSTFLNSNFNAMYGIILLIAIIFIVFPFIKNRKMNSHKKPYNVKEI
jgi:membrane protease YdiL (CAAX protease family)